MQYIRPSVIHLLRGQVYSIQGKTFFTMGGTSNHDINGVILEPDDPQFKRKCKSLNHRGVSYRGNHRSWWKEKLPSDDEYRTARANLEKCDYKVDYSVIHCGPISVQDEVGGGFYKANALTDFLEEVANRCQFKYWLFEHYHGNGIIRQKYILISCIKQ